MGLAPSHSWSDTRLYIYIYIHMHMCICMYVCMNRYFSFANCIACMTPPWGLWGGRRGLDLVEIQNGKKKRKNRRQGPNMVNKLSNFRTSFRSRIGSRRELRTKLDNCSVWNCVPSLCDVFKNTNNHQLLIDIQLCQKHTSKNMLVKQNSCSKHETPCTGLGVQSVFKCNPTNILWVILFYCY